MKSPSLPARVRVSRLESAPPAAVLASLKKLDPGRAAALEGTKVLAVAIAGGAPIGYAVWHGFDRVTVLSRSWLNQGIEAALEETLGPAPAPAWTALAPEGAVCDPVTGVCEVPGAPMGSSGWTPLEPQEKP